MSQRRKIPIRKRFEVFKRDAFTCAYCGRRPPDVELQLDHVRPVAGGGSDKTENLRTACAQCNNGKSDVPLAVTAAAPVTTPAPGGGWLVGRYCHKTSTDPEHTRFGWNFQYQCRVEAVMDGVAMLLFFDAIMGDPSDIKPVPLAELLGGKWVFYSTRDDWLHAAEAAQERYWRGKRRPA